MGICGEKLGRCQEHGRVSLTVVSGDFFCSALHGYSSEALLQQETFITPQLYPSPHPDDFLNLRPDLGFELFK